MTTTDMLDTPMTARDFLHLIGHVRDTKPRDGLRALEDAVLDVVARAERLPEGAA